MTLRYLMDENVDPLFVRQIRKKEPELPIQAVGEPGVPPKGTLDPEILMWCETHGAVLATNHRRSMPVHLAEHLAGDRHVPGILILNPNMEIEATIEELILIALCAFEDEFQDRIGFLPVP